MRRSVSLLRLRECGGGSQKGYTDPPAHDELARVKLDMTAELDSRLTYPRVGPKSKTKT